MTTSHALLSSPAPEGKEKRKGKGKKLESFAKTKRGEEEKLCIFINEAFVAEKEEEEVIKDNYFPLLLQCKLVVLQQEKPGGE